MATGLVDSRVSLKAERKEHRIQDELVTEGNVPMSGERLYTG